MGLGINKLSEKKPPSKAAVKKAAKTLSNPKASTKEKSSAGKTLAKKSVESRKIQPAPKTGKISRENIKRAVASVSSNKKKK